jgi:hypothetical protein
LLKAVDEEVGSKNLKHKQKRGSFEGLGIVFLEASASAMAVICTQGGAMPDLSEVFDVDRAMFVNNEPTAELSQASFGSCLQ